jgi:hypothetical protein
MTIDLHNPSANSENHTEIRIGDYKNIMAYGGWAGLVGFNEETVIEVIQNIPQGIEGDDDLVLPPSWDKHFILSTECLDNFDVLVKSKTGGWAKAMLRNRATGRILFRSATWLKDHPRAKSYKQSHNSEWVVGRKMFVASRGFWVDGVLKYFNEH